MLDVAPLDPNEGDDVTATASGGETGQTYMLAAIELNGFPIFEVLVFDVMDEWGRYSITDAIPSGSSGITFTLQAYSIKYWKHRTVFSNAEQVTVQ